MSAQVVRPTVIEDVHVEPGPALLSGLHEGPPLAAHVARLGELPVPSLEDLVALVGARDLRGRGGAGFPFARKLTTAARASGRPVVVVNFGEGEPASLKDAALATAAPHLVLDGAAVTARALGVRTVHVVLPAHDERVARALERAVAERTRARWPSREDPRRLSWHLHRSDAGFVAGQASAVVELMAGRTNLPVTAWEPVTVAGHRGRPTVLSNAETYAQVAQIVLGTEQADTVLLTLDGDRAGGVVPRVLEVPVGTPWAQVLGDDELAVPVLLGGYHGTWAAPGQLAGLRVCRDELADHGLALGAGIVLPLRRGCPVVRTADVTAYLAGQSAGRCGPCLNGLPALSREVDALRDGAGSRSEVARLSALLERRGACAHPDGTVRLVASLLRAYGDEPALHAQGSCGFGETGRWSR